MIEFINEPVGVETQTRRDGTLRPLAFVWQGRRFPIESWGRESSQTQAGRSYRSYLVQTAGPESWELRLDTETAQWTLVRHWASRTRIV